MVQSTLITERQQNSLLLTSTIFTSFQVTANSILKNDGVAFFADLGKPIIVGHGPCLQGLGCVLVHQRAPPVVFSFVPGVGDVDDVVTGHTQRWWLTVRLYVEINPHIEGVRTHETGC